MKLLIASDIHGDAECAAHIIKVFESKECERILLLGDILYHGPRNDLPKNYNPKAVISLLNKYADKIFAVRGNCEAEVDQMVLDFPVMTDYALLHIDGITMYATHGHIYNIDNPPKLKKGDVLLHGHTHIPGFWHFGEGNLCMNPGSASLPKENNPKSYAIFERGVFTIYDFSEAVMFSHKAID